MVLHILTYLVPGYLSPSSERPPGLIILPDLISREYADEICQSIGWDESVSKGNAVIVSVRNYDVGTSTILYIHVLYNILQTVIYFRAFLFLGDFHEDIHFQNLKQHKSVF